jgi:hypothetical protein
MRIQTIFAILLVLLSLCRVGDLCGAASHYIEARGLLSLGQVPGTTHDEAASAALRERSKDALTNAIQTCVEIIMLAGVGACFFVMLRRSKAHLQERAA